MIQMNKLVARFTQQSRTQIVQIPHDTVDFWPADKIVRKLAHPQLANNQIGLDYTQFSGLLNLGLPRNYFRNTDIENRLHTQ